MGETNLGALRSAPSRPVGPDFTAAVFARIGLDRYVSAASAVGEVFIAWRSDGVSALRIAGDPATFETWYGERFGRRVVPALEEDPISAAAQAKLRGEDVEVPIDLGECSPFERRVLEKAAEITRCNARPYSWVARELGQPDATRAVGNALGRNPVPLLIPCHRVIRTDCTVGGYVFGSATKRTLLEEEGLDFAAIERVTNGGFRYIGDDEDGVFCLPTCGTVATRMGSPGFVALRSADEAHAHGLRPCSSCRPIAA